MKLIRFILFLILLTGTIFAYSQPIVIGVLKFAPPFSSMGPNNTLFGFYIDLMNEICKRIQQTCTYKAVNLDQQITELDEGSIDLALPPTPIPQNIYPEYVYSLPYMTSNGQFLAFDPNIKSIADLKDKKIGVLQASNLDNVLLLYTAKENIREYKKPDQLLLALENKEIDSVLLNVNIVSYLINNKVINPHLVGKPISLGNGYGIVALKPKAPLISKINKALLEIQNDGTYEIIYNKYFAR